MKFRLNYLVLLLLLSVITFENVAQATDTLTIYSARREELVAPLMEQFTEDTDIEVNVRYGNLAEMVVMILEEGDNSPADVFFAQDASGLGAFLSLSSVSASSASVSDQSFEWTTIVPATASKGIA